MAQTIDDQIRNAAMIGLRNMDAVTIDVVRNAVAQATNYLATLHGRSTDEIDIDAIVRDIETSRAVWAPDSSELLDTVGHIPWLDDKMDGIRWDYWHRYEFYLEHHQKMPTQVVERLDTVTNRVLRYLEDPARKGVWTRRGMVVGQVQSGKTSNYTGLICKAVDAGYKLIVVLAGMHNSLRSQTQLRLDEGFIGRDTKQSRVFTQESGVLGVGNVVLTDRRLAVYSPTSSADDGDFRAQIARQFTTYIGSDPVILVVKKNGSILNHLLRWVRSNIAMRDASGAFVVRGLPILMLDDEADNASVNTSEDSPTRINSLIRQILKTFDQSAYVGYTATPFANIFIPPDANTAELGDDLFPRSFIINLHPPTNYIGPTQVFGLSALPDAGIEAASGLPIVRLVTDNEPFIPSSHKNHATVSELPPTLREAIRAFILSCAARRARGQTTAHNSMLVHVTRFNSVQQAVADLVSSELRNIRQRIEYGDGGRVPSIIDELHELWQNDFVPTTVAVAERLDDDRIVSLEWADIERQLKASSAKIQVRTINGLAGDVLDYFDHPNGISVIAVGGDKLSRGLTLEGLSVSYYLRASRMYDTLMQMGRWFGYRPGYADLCRLYTSTELQDWYEHVTVASEELRQEFDLMANAGMTPLDYGLKVQTHPGGLTVTSAGKMRSGQVVRVSFARSLVESYRLLKAAEVIKHNYDETNSFLSSLSNMSRTRQQLGHVWSNVEGQFVAAYLDRLIGHKDIPAADPRKLSEYIAKKMVHGELVNWTVVLIDREGSDGTEAAIGGIPSVKMTPRKPDDEKSDALTYAVSNRHIISESDEWVDLSPEEYAAATLSRQAVWDAKPQVTERPKKPSGPFVRAERSPTRGLLLIYPLDPQKDNLFADPLDARRNGPPIIAYAVSFPDTARRTETVEYLVNTVYMKEEDEFASETA